MAEADPVVLVCVPAGQLLHCVAPLSSWYVPIGHGGQAPLPDVEEYVPTSQAVQIPPVPAAYLPGGQNWHCPAEVAPITVLWVPAGQGKQSTTFLAAVFVPYVPAGHGKQVVDMLRGL